MSLYKKIQFLIEDEQFYRMNRDDQGKIREIVFGFGGHDREHLENDGFLIENCLSPHWAQLEQIKFINKKYEKLGGK